MKKLLWILTFGFLGAAVGACGDDDNSINLDKYQDWKEQNEAWLEQMEAKKNPDGSPYFEKVVPAWNPGAYILMHYFNDRAQTADNLSPLYTSTVDVRYIGYDCNDEPFDSSSIDNSYGRLGIRRFAVNGLIQGWSIALMDMHVGDTAEIIIPYEIAYGTSSSGTLAPYSSLRFNLRLDDIYKYEANPY